MRAFIFRFARWTSQEKGPWKNHRGVPGNRGRVANNGDHLIRQEEGMDSFFLKGMYF